MQASGETEIKIWNESAAGFVVADSRWMWVEPDPPPAARRRPALMSLTSRPESCQPQDGCLVTARGAWDGDGRPYVRVRYGTTYWVQTLPRAAAARQWSAGGVVIGQPERPGTRFDVCVVASSDTVYRGQQLSASPEGPMVCKAVTRGRP